MKVEILNQQKILTTPGNGKFSARVKAVNSAKYLENPDSYPIFCRDCTNKCICGTIPDFPTECFKFTDDLLDD
jgi:hypothetical protein